MSLSVIEVLSLLSIDDSRLKRSAAGIAVRQEEVAIAWEASR